MKQPDLGKKIVELRKAKGFTQEELVEKCNLNVRTLQRIESGEVTPRSFTLKLIFVALDYNVSDSSESTDNKFRRSEFIIVYWLEQFYRYLLDLFNLKTNKMRKISILSIISLSALSFLLIFCQHTIAQNKDKVSEQFGNANAKFIHYFNSGQIDSLGLLYLDSASLIFDNIIPVLSDNLPSIKGREAIKGLYKIYHIQGLIFNERKSKSMVITDSIVVDMGILRLKSDSTHIKNGTYFCQWHFINGNWSIENEMFNFDK